MNEIVGRPAGTYSTPNGQVSEVVSLESGRSYLFTMLDVFGDGMCCGNGIGKYSVYVEDSLVAFGSEYKLDETQRFVIGNDYPINLVIGTDLYAGEVAWYLERLDLDEGVANVAISPFQYDGQSSTTITETVIGEEGGVYRFVILDAGDDGTCCEFGNGFYRVFVGDADTSDQNSAVILSRGDQYKDRAEHVFLAKWPQPSADNLPADASVLTLEFTFDDYPGDVIYILKAEDIDDGVATSRSASQQSVIAFGPPEPFPQSLGGAFVSIDIKIPRIPAGTTRAFTFILIDSQDDGLCCDYGRGSYTLYYGPKSVNQVILSGTGQNQARVVHGFVLSDQGIESVTSPSAGFRLMSTYGTLSLTIASVAWMLC